MLTEKILHEFETILGKERILTSKEDLLSYAYDAYVEEYLPEAVLFPKTSAEVSQIMQVASTHRILGVGSGSDQAMLLIFIRYLSRNRRF